MNELGGKGDLMNDTEFAGAIDKIPPGGWRRSETGREFRRLGVFLCQWGLSDKQAVEVLSRAYRAAAAEFGS